MSDLAPTVFDALTPGSSIARNRVAPHSPLGSQLLLDLYDCDACKLDDLDGVRVAMLGAATAAGATIVESVFHRFSPWGVSGVVVISESHLAIHTWPERRYAAIDVFTCGVELRLDMAQSLLIRAFSCRRPVEHFVTRGTQLRHDGAGAVTDPAATMVSE